MSDLGATVEVKYDGVLRHFGAGDLVDLALDRIAPVRISKAYPGRRNYSGVYWARTTGRHHWFESLYEKSALTALDRDPAIVNIATQPFRVSRGGRKGHVPDILAERVDRSRLLVDVRPRPRITERALVTFEMTATWCSSLAIDYRLFADLSKVQDWNLRLLAGYRYARWCCPQPVAQLLAQRAGEVRPLRDWARLFDGADIPTRGLLLAAIWHGALDVDLSERLELDVDAVCTGRGWT
ncbi:TnsA-like heteromeric transposase endonuclease subunit [Microbacterium sp. B2969]|uniref:TnsA-like heteromeric transposase endonuclease subunit n=1 Tax=Microbacterium alkaliflavum TaxID=3248839 RepID=A0ABW7QE74_9MICO